MRERTGEAPLVEIMHPLVGLAEELRRLRELTVRAAEEEGGDVEYLVGTMIELPRACVRADEIAEHADFFSFGTNDLTQTALGLSRDDAGRFLPHYLEQGILERDPFETLDQDGRRRPDADRGRARARRARTGSSSASAASTAATPRSIAFCAELGLRLRLLLAVPRAGRAARRGAGRARRVAHRRSTSPPAADTSRPGARGAEAERRPVEAERGAGCSDAPPRATTAEPGSRPVLPARPLA